LKAHLSDTGIVVPEGRNPIVKMPVLVSGDQGTVYIDELPAIETIDAGGGQEGQQQHDRLSNRPSGDQLRNQMLQLQSGILSLRRENIELRNDIAALKLIIESGFATVNGNVRRVAIQPGRRQVTTASGMDLLAGAAATGTTDGNEGATMLAPALAMMNPPP
jgi:hypothetical protein